MGTIDSSRIRRGALGSPQRLLVPIDGTEEALRSINYVLDKTRGGQPLEVVLLYAVAPVRSWEVLKFRTESEVRKFFQSKADIFLQEAADSLSPADIPVIKVFREVEPVDAINAVAEEYGCTEVVMPRPDYWGLLSSRLPFKVKKACHTPVTLISSRGAPVT